MEPIIFHRLDERYSRYSSFSVHPEHIWIEKAEDFRCIIHIGQQSFLVKESFEKANEMWKSALQKPINVDAFIDKGNY